jgi:hypothetical protein
MRLRFEALLVVSVFVLALGGLASAKGPVSGTWSCVAHGPSGPDFNYTFNLEQTPTQVTGNFTGASTDGGMQTHDVKNGSFKDGKLELHFEDEEGAIDVTGGLDGKDAMKGNWSQGDHGGTWECKRGSAAVPASH